MQFPTNVVFPPFHTSVWYICIVSGTLKIAVSKLSFAAAHLVCILSDMAFAD